MFTLITFYFHKGRLTKNFCMYYIQENWGPNEETVFNSLLDSFVEPKHKKARVATSPYFKEKALVANLPDDIERALEKHIEGMEPNFRSATFQQLWFELRQPLTNTLRPRKLEEMLSELHKCELGDKLHPYEFPTDIDSIQRDLAICKIGEILEKKVPASQRRCSHIWTLLKNPLTGCFKVARLSSLMDELTQCFPRFELAGIKYQVPSKMSEVKRDVVICKVDEILNESRSYTDEM